ncbi:LysR substrate-binding domain-containing protein [Vibrio sonorensis]|uniref:LysR substrate-binding domain-containing protein n=1 Tax=Vibrio sonorensis TaxID=1004316 RepID=UPI0008D9B0F7|nr:LysR substrate-binding domain-containing protein [Vibrio sonorensis]
MKASKLSGLNLIVQIAGHQSLSSAAKAMFLTTGAVSQQLLAIENQLGFSVFERHSRGIRITEKGALLLEKVQPHFQAIEHHVEHISKLDDHQSIRLKLTPSLAFKWLVPRLEQFYQAHRDIQVYTFAEGALVDSERQDYDIAIDYGPIPYARPNAELLMEEWLLPVMTPDYWQQHKALEMGDSKVWQEVTLLHDAMPWNKAKRDSEWRFWSEQRQFDIDTNRGHFFNRTDMAMSAAEAGVGIALARQALITNELDSNRLIAPFSPIPANAGYFLIIHSHNQATRLFSQWLRQQVSR